MSNTMYAKHDKTLAALDEAMLLAEARKEHRGHMGFSGLCDPDMRTTWLKFRWCLPDNHAPRTLRIFRLGHIIEAEVIALMRSIPGLDWHDVDSNGNQFKFSYLGGHVGGSMDGAVIGVPEAPKTWHVGEIKSAKDEQFKALKKAGSYDAWNPTYFGQLQCYMGASGMTRGIALVYNKDTSELYQERIKPVPGFFENAMIHAQDLLEVAGPPDSIYSRTSYQIANYKDEKYQRIYWGDELPVPNCRNCKHAQIKYDGDARWYCSRWEKDRTVAEQRAGCDLHLYMPSLMPAMKLEDNGLFVRYKTLDGMEFWNAEDISNHPGQHVYRSLELHAITEGGGLSKDFLNNPVPMALRSQLDAQFATG